VDYMQVIRDMDRATYERMKQALETGRWPDGRLLTEDQRSHTMQAVIAWGELHLPEQERVGFINKGRKAGKTCGDEDDTQTLTVLDGVEQKTS